MPPMMVLMTPASGPKLSRGGVRNSNVRSKPWAEATGKTSPYYRGGSLQVPTIAKTAGPASLGLALPRLASPCLASRRLASPRLALPRLAWPPNEVSELQK